MDYSALIGLKVFFRAVSREMVKVPSFLSKERLLALVLVV